PSTVLVHLQPSTLHPPLPSFPTRRSSDLTRSRSWPSTPHTGRRLQPSPALGPTHPRSGRPASRFEDRRSARGSFPSRDRAPPRRDRKSTRLNSSHRTISYAVFCLKKKSKI